MPQLQYEGTQYNVTTNEQYILAVVFRTIEKKKGNGIVSVIRPLVRTIATSALPFKRPALLQLMNSFSAAADKRSNLIKVNGISGFAHVCNELLANDNFRITVTTVATAKHGGDVSANTIADIIFAELQAIAATADLSLKSLQAFFVAFGKNASVDKIDQDARDAFLDSLKKAKAAGVTGSAAKVKYRGEEHYLSTDDETILLGVFAAIEDLEAQSIASDLRPNIRKLGETVPHSSNPKLLTINPDPAKVSARKNVISRRLMPLFHPDKHKRDQLFKEQTGFVAACDNFIAQYGWQVKLLEKVSGKNTIYDVIADAIYAQLNLIKDTKIKSKDDDIVETADPGLLLAFFKAFGGDAAIDAKESYERKQFLSKFIPNPKYVVPVAPAKTAFTPAKAPAVPVAPAPVPPAPAPAAAAPAPAAPAPAAPAAPAAAPAPAAPAPVPAAPVPMTATYTAATAPAAAVFAATHGTAAASHVDPAVAAALGKISGGFKRKPKA
jgi:hypothetical protein